MEGFNWWGVFTFVTPIVLAILIGLISVITVWLDVISKLLKNRRY